MYNYSSSPGVPGTRNYSSPLVAVMLEQLNVNLMNLEPKKMTFAEMFTSN